MKIKELLSISMIGLGLAHAPDSLAADINWSAQTGDFLTAANWAGGLPGATDPMDIVIISNGGTATIGANAGNITFGGLRLGPTRDSSESGHIIMNGGRLNLGGNSGDPKALIGNSATLSTFIMNGGTIYFDGPDQGGGSSAWGGVNNLDWEVGEQGLGRFEMHSNAVFYAADDLKIAENAAGKGEVIIDGNARAAFGSGISVSGGGAGAESTMVIGGNAVVDAGNSMGAGNPLGGTDEGYLTMASGGSLGKLTIQDSGVLNIRRLTAREGNSTIVVKDRGQFHIFEVLTGAGTNAATRPAVTGPNSSYASAGTGTLTLQDDAQMTVNSAPESGPTQGLAIGGRRDANNPGGKAIFTIRDRASFRVEQDLSLGSGMNPETADGTLEIRGASANVSIGGNLNMAVDTDGAIVGVDADGNPKAGKATLAAVITGSTHSPVNVSGIARIANGALKVKLDGYTPAAGNTFTLVKGGTVEGQFASTDYSEAALPAGLNWELEYKPDAVNLKVTGQAAGGRVITVTTADNANPGTGVSLVMALQSATEGDTIAFNIPGEGPHFIKTPADGYPIINRDNVTIDGYTQPGAAPNTNSIHAPNSAKLKIVLDSREGGRTKMNYGTGRPGYGDSETAILGVFNAANVTIKGLAFLGLHTTNSDEDPSIYCIAFARDHTGSPTYDDNGHVAGCWFGVEPNGTNVTGGSATAVAAFRHRDVSGGTLPELPNRNLTVGVKAGSANPRAEFNVMVGMSYHLAGEQIGARVSGNFIGLLPDGRTPYDMTLEGRPFAGASLEIGRYNDSTILIGTDGDSVNDADEGNVFGPLTGGQRVLAFYSTGNKRFVIAGNYFGVAVDGVTPLPGSFQIAGAFGAANVVQFGSDMNGVSDALEGNLVVNNHPFPADPAAIINPIHASAGAKVGVRRNSLVNNYPLPVNVAGTTIGLNNPDPATFYAAHLADPTKIQPVITSAGAELVGTVPVPVSTFVSTMIDLYVADPEGIASGKSLNIAELPNGFVQGKTYVASFTDNSPADKNPAAGAFTFDISSLGVADSALTITANYSEQPPGSTNPVVVTTPFSEPAQVTVQPGLPKAPADNGATPKTATLYINTPDTINNGKTESLGLTILNNGNVVVGWEDDHAEDTSLQYLAAVWTMLDPNGNLITPPTPQPSLAVGGSITSRFLSYFRADRSAVPGFTSWGPKIKANLFGDGFGMGATSYGLGYEVAELASTQNNAAGENAGDFPSVQLLTSGGQPIAIASGLDEAYAERDGDVRIGDWDFLSNGNILVVGESRQRDDLVAVYGGETAATHAVFRIVTPTGSVVKPVTLASELPIGSEIWHGSGVTANGFAIRMGIAGRGVIRLFNNDGTPASTNIDLAERTGFAINSAGGRGDSVGFHGNSKDAYVLAVAGNDPEGQPAVWVSVLNANGTLRYSKKVSDDVSILSPGRMDAAIDESGRVFVAYDALLPFDDGSQTIVNPRIVMGRLLDPAGNPVGGTFYVSEKELPAVGTLEARRPRVALRNGVAAVAWESLNAGSALRTVAVRLFNVGGTTGGGDLEVFISAAGPNSLLLEWEGGSGPYLVQRKSSFADATWMNVLTTSEMSARVPNDGTTGFFRVQSGATNSVSAMSLVMSSAFEPGTITSAGTGRGTVSLEGNKLSFDIKYSGLTGPASAAHIHGYTNTTANAGVLINLQPFNGGAFGVGGRMAGSVELDAAQRAGLLAGDTYVNIHTAANGGGEIRGQLIPATLSATLNGAQETPTAVDTPATGTGKFTLVGDELFVDVTYSGLKQAISNAHIHGPAPVGTGAGVLVDMVPLHTGTMNTSTSGGFQGRVTLNATTLKHLIDGLTYFNIHSAAHGGGEIRGQIVP